MQIQAMQLTLNSGTMEDLNEVKFQLNGNYGHVVGDAGTIKATSNGGVVWHTQVSNTYNVLRAVTDYNSTSTSYAVGDAGTIRKTTDYGNS